MSIEALLENAAFPPETRLSLAVGNRLGSQSLASGRWPDGSGVRETDLLYAASLAKQVTATVAACGEQSRLDVDAPVAEYVPGLPDWAKQVTSRQLAHHIAGLPTDAEADLGDPTEDWTQERALAALRRIATLPRQPTEAYAYSNLGYVLLAEAIAGAAGRPFPDVAATMLSELGIEGMAFAGSVVDAFPQTSLLGPALPLTVGDGGLWCAASSYVKWLLAMNTDVLNLASTLTEPGRLMNGATTDYGWGIGLRQYRGAPLYIHGGEWTGAVAKAVRSPSLGLAVVALASGPSIGAISALVDAVLDAQVNG